MLSCPSRVQLLRGWSGQGTSFFWRCCPRRTDHRSSSSVGLQLHRSRGSIHWTSSPFAVHFTRIACHCHQCIHVSISVSFSCTLHFQTSWFYSGVYMHFLLDDSLRITPKSETISAPESVQTDDSGSVWCDTHNKRKIHNSGAQFSSTLCPSPHRCYCGNNLYGNSFHSHASDFQHREVLFSSIVQFSIFSSVSVPRSLRSCSTSLMLKPSNGTRTIRPLSAFSL